MLIEVQGTGFVNKGAELMLHSVLEKIRAELPEAEVIMDPSWGSAPYLKRACLGLYQKVALKYRGVQWGRFGKVIPKRIRQMYGLKLDSEVDVILDAAGFAYSDQHGPGVTQNMAATVKHWKKNNTKIIFLPQAFGPFVNEKSKKAIRSIVEHADLLFARDKVSYDYLTELVGVRENVRISPDFTNLVEGVLPEEFDRKANRFCIIPNKRMLSQVGDEDRGRYVPFLIECAKYLNQKGVKPFILIHEGEADLRLGQEVARGAGGNMNIIREEDPLKIKGIIGACDGVIGSRFHGLVSALSQGIPALATGWSHKYEMLFQDYGFPEGMISVQSDRDEIQKKISMLISEEENSSLREKISSAAILQKQAAIRMWEDVFSLIK